MKKILPILLFLSFAGCVQAQSGYHSYGWKRLIGAPYTLTDFTDTLGIVLDTNAFGGQVDTLRTPWDTNTYLFYDGHHHLKWVPITGGSGISQIYGRYPIQIYGTDTVAWNPNLLTKVTISPATDDTPLVIHANNSVGEIPIFTAWSSGGSPTKLFQIGDDGELYFAPTGGLIDGSGSAGSAGQVLESQGSATLTPLWTTLSINNSIYTDTVLNNTLTFCDTIQAGEHDNFRHTTNNIYYYATTDASSVLTGIDTSLQNGYFLCIQNQSQRPNGIIVLDNENTASKPQDRIMTGIGKDLVIARFENALLVYVPKYDTDAGGVGDTVGRWVVVGGTAYERNSTGNTNYIYNQFSSAQTSSNFWIDGTGQVGSLNVAPGASNSEGTITTTTTLPLSSFLYKLPYHGGTFIVGDTGAGILTVTAPLKITNADGVTTISDTATGGGGMTNPMTTLGDIIYENATPTAARLAGNTNNYIESLTSTATTGTAQAPVWSALPGTNYGVSTSWYAGGAASASTTGADNTAIGNLAAHSVTAGTDITAVGYKALLGNTPSAAGSTAVGSNALANLGAGAGNTAVGYYALSTDYAGANNTAVGYEALKSDYGGSQNTAIGYQALHAVSAGVGNCAVGYQELYNNTGSYNTAMGWSALQANTSGGYSSAFGEGALNANTTGIDNSAFGAGSLGKCTTGSYNTALGYNALYTPQTDSFNTAIGYSALGNLGTSVGFGQYNTAIGDDAGLDNWTGSSDIFLGYYSAYNQGMSHSQSNVFVAGGDDASGNGHILNVYFGSGIYARSGAGGTGYTINGSGANGTNLAGGSVTIASGKGTGTGTPGALNFDLPVPGSSGTTLQTLQQVGSISALGSDAKLVNYTFGGSLNNGMPQVIIVPDTVEANNTTGGITIPGASDVKITHGSETGAFKITLPSGTEGQQLTITNTTSYTAGFASGTGVIIAGETKHYEYLNGAWQDLNALTMRPQSFVSQDVDLTAVVGTTWNFLTPSGGTLAFPTVGFTYFIPTDIIIVCTSVTGPPTGQGLEVGDGTVPGGVLATATIPTIATQEIIQPIPARAAGGSIYGAGVTPLITSTGQAIGGTLHVRVFMPGIYY